MAIYSNIDIETFKWVKGEVELTLDSASGELQKFVASSEKENLYVLTNHLHQVVGSLQMLEMKALSSLMMESELLVEDFSAADSTIGKSTFVVLLDSAFAALRATFSRIENGLPENPIDVVELINQIRSTRGLAGIEISSLFSPMIEVFPEVDSSRALKDSVYIERAKALRGYYQTFLLNWLRDADDAAIDKLGLVVDKLLQMSTFGSVARLWWVAAAYIDYVKHNDVANKSAHSRIFRQIDDRFRELETQGESALVRDPADELIKIMLFYVGVGEKRTERMDEIVDAFKLQEYFPALKLDEDAVDFYQLEANLTELADGSDLPLTLIRQLVTAYFENEQTDTSGLNDILAQLEIVEAATGKKDTGILHDIAGQSTELIRGMRRGLVARDDDTGFHLASALMFVENSLNNPTDVDANWLQNGKLKRQALIALNNQEELSDSLDGAHLSGSERQALLDVVGAEVEENLKDIEAKLEAFAHDPSRVESLAGIDGKIRQVRGALQVLGEQKVGLLLKMAEEQFVALETGKAEATPELAEALAIAIGTMEEYVKGLQANRTGMDYLLDRSITDLEVAVGKTVSRDDVEDLLDSASDSLFSWLGNQSDFDLFTNLKSSLRDLMILAKKTRLSEVQHLVKEQERLVDVISQEPAFLTDNITANLQNNMVSITEHIIELYGTEETKEEAASDAELAYRKSAIEAAEDDDAVRFHDEMDIAELDDELVGEIAEAEQSPDKLSSTEIGKLAAAEQRAAPEVDEAIFEVFIEESVEVLGEANIQYEILKADLSDRTALRELRRAFHTLKGSARMVGLNDAGEVAWLSESLFNYVLDTEKPLSLGTLGFAREALDEFQVQVDNRYAEQHLIDTAAWGAKAEHVNKDGDVAEQGSLDEASTAAVAATTIAAAAVASAIASSEDDAAADSELTSSGGDHELEAGLLNEDQALEASEPVDSDDTVDSEDIADSEDIVDSEGTVDSADTVDINQEVDLGVSDESELDEPREHDVDDSIIEEASFITLEGEELTLEDSPTPESDDVSSQELELEEPVVEDMELADFVEDQPEQSDDDDGEIEEFSLSSDSITIGFDDLELEELDAETSPSSENAGNTAPNDDKLAEMLEMNSESSIIEFASELVLEEDSVMEFSNEELSEHIVGGDDDAELEPQSVTSSLINDPEVRQVFVSEAEEKLAMIATELAKDDVSFSPEAPLSIAIHTLLGNARTLDLKDIASAYECAEDLCQAKQQNASSITDAEREQITSLVAESAKGLENRSEEFPFYDWDLDAFEAVVLKLKESLDSELNTKINEAAEAASINEETLAEFNLDDLDDIELEFDDGDLSEIELVELDSDVVEDADGVDGIDDDEVVNDVEDIDDDESDSEPVVAESDAERVAAVFDGLDPIDDLVDEASDTQPFEETDVDEQTLVVEDDDLTSLELSLSAFNDDDVVDEASDIDADQDSAADPAEAEKGAAAISSLIPDDLTDLLEDDVLSFAGAGGSLVGDLGCEWQEGEEEK